MRIKPTSTGDVSLIRAVKNDFICWQNPESIFTSSLWLKKRVFKLLFYLNTACRRAKVSVSEHLFYIVYIYLISKTDTVKIESEQRSLSEHLSSPFVKKCTNKPTEKPWDTFRFAGQGGR